jgi:glycosyltransferase involved in cell wall biosynthesis
MNENNQHQQTLHKPRFSILIPTWNNLEYLKFCINSLRKNSRFTNQIIVFVNEGKDGTAEWLAEQKDIDFIHDQQNKGVCYAVNACRTLVETDYIVYMNDDMYACPDWDFELMEEIKQLETDSFYISATLIEPVKLNNPNYVAIIRDFGDSPETFNEEDLLSELPKLQTENWRGSSWPPSVVHKKIWDLVGGFSIEFTPGMYSDPDFSMKLWQAGVRIFMGVGKSKVYHFGAKSTKRVRKNKGSDTFLRKWGITANTFYSKILGLGKKYEGPYPESIEIDGFSKLRNKLKRIAKSF